MDQKPPKKNGQQYAKEKNERIEALELENQLLKDKIEAMAKPTGESSIFNMLAEMNFSYRDIQKHYDMKIRGYSGNLCFTNEFLSKFR